MNLCEVSLTLRPKAKAVLFFFLVDLCADYTVLARRVAFSDLHIYTQNRIVLIMLTQLRGKKNTYIKKMKCYSCSYLLSLPPVFIPPFCFFCIGCAMPVCRRWPEDLSFFPRRREHKTTFVRLCRGLFLWVTLSHRLSAKKKKTENNDWLCLDGDGWGAVTSRDITKRSRCKREVHGKGEGPASFLPLFLRTLLSRPQFSPLLSIYMVLVLL